MSVENGEWIMHGIPANDPNCIHSVKELTTYIEGIGFLPLFQNDIPGFSVEERTVPDYWWSGDKANDPWEWREIIAREGNIAYGKFFDKKAGFISKKWLPYFCNYRRDGYDFDALWDDAKASLRQKKIMDLFIKDDTMLYSSEVKKNAGFGSGGEKNFEGTMASLQMQTYLCVSDFRQRKNRKGQAYGWPIAVYAKPETLWGRDIVTAAYQEEPAVSAKRIAEHIQDIYPIASVKQAKKVIGVTLCHLK